MAIRDQRQATVSKRTTLLADVDVALPHGLDHMIGKCFFHREMNCPKNASFIAGDCNKNKYYIVLLHVLLNIVTICLVTYLFKSWKKICNKKVKNMSTITLPDISARHLICLVTRRWPCNNPFPSCGNTNDILLDSRLERETITFDAADSRSTRRTRQHL